MSGVKWKADVDAMFDYMESKKGYENVLKLI